MILSKKTLKNINVPGLQKPDEHIFNLPEKVLQFGTGVLLRGLPDYYIDKANRAGVFNGRVVVVKSTATGSTDAFAEQDNLYTIYADGIEDGKEVSEKLICSSISRVLSASDEWRAILNFARSEDLQVVISNTTEVGITLVEESIKLNPPKSFPAKLLAVLHERFKAFNGDKGKGLIIVPTELIVNNGKKLRAVVLELAKLNGLDDVFINWVEDHNTFCDSLVDRIVPGKPNKEQMAVIDAERGFTDELTILSETYSLWAIEGDEKVASVLSFAKVNKGIVIAPDIDLFRELKLRLLNGSHTMSCALAFLSGFETVKDAMDDEKFNQFITALMFNELIPAIPYRIDREQADNFANSVLDRFRNPNIRHEWIAISAQYSAKIKMRVLPLLLNRYRKNNSAPAHIALGFAAYIRFMKTTKDENGNFIGEVDGRTYKVTDDKAELLHQLWQNNDTDLVVENVLKNEELWGTDLTALSGFKAAVADELKSIIRDKAPIAA